MRDMTEQEIRKFVKEWTWGTLIGVEDNKPYAVEVSYGTDGEFIYCGSMPGGRMARCIIANPNVVYKICDSDRSYNKWRAVIIEGKAERLTNYDDILYAVHCIARQRGLPENTFDNIARRITNDPESNSIRLPIRVFGGRASG
jgi:nitroimidazol reductase NimA-like FMN-containing flavoprotein (pyridoxamine 5'-phosphate oxidase superfamily)